MDYRHNPSFGSIILEDLYTSSGMIIILPIGGYLHVFTFYSGLLWDLEELAIHQPPIRPPSEFFLGIHRSPTT